MAEDVISHRMPVRVRGAVRVRGRFYGLGYGKLHGLTRHVYDTSTRHVALYQRGPAQSFSGAVRRSRDVVLGAPRIHTAHTNESSPTLITATLITDGSASKVSLAQNLSQAGLARFATIHLQARAQQDARATCL